MTSLEMQDARLKKSKDHSTKGQPSSTLIRRYSEPAPSTTRTNLLNERDKKDVPGTTCHIKSEKITEKDRVEKIKIKQSLQQQQQKSILYTDASPMPPRGERRKRKFSDQLGFDGQKPRSRHRHAHQDRREKEYIAYKHGMNLEDLYPDSD